jgi:hypothetical protein
MRPPSHGTSGRSPSRRSSQPMADRRSCNAHEARAPCEPDFWQETAATVHDQHMASAGKGSKTTVNARANAAQHACKASTGSSRKGRVALESATVKPPLSRCIRRAKPETRDLWRINSPGCSRSKWKFRATFATCRSVRREVG